MDFVQDHILDTQDHKNEPVIKPQYKDQMTSSMISTTSSLTSPVDSGVQLLDSESEIASVMSTSGMGCDVIPNMEFENICEADKSCKKSVTDKLKGKAEVMTSSDIVNQNVEEFLDYGVVERILQEDCDSDSVFKADETMKDTTNNTEVDLMNISLNSYELLDYTDQNAGSALINPGTIDLMHVSMSEEVSEGKFSIDSKQDTELPVDEQIVFRRQRKKKSKSDTPKKRVSFHEDILNSTKIDDIHINHGFITHEDISVSFFQRGFVRKPDVVKGRYSWAAEGDAPYYEKKVSDRQVKSDIYIHHPRYSSSSSSSSNSFSSSIDEEEPPVQFTDEIIQDLVKKTPKSSCLKKTKRKKYIETNIVPEEKRKSDGNIFGSLKNILNFSASLPITERGVPEGQEDILVFSSTREACVAQLPEENVSVAHKRAGNLSLDFSKNNLKLTKSENTVYPKNILLCDSNVYEHKGISYSYEYDEFKKTFEQKNKPKSSTLYQTILKEFNFFRKKATQQQPEPESTDQEIENLTEIIEPEPKQVESRTSSVIKLDWSDNDTITTVSDFTDNPNPRHLNSPKRKISKPNHYSVQPFKADTETLRSSPLKGSSSKSSLINRFLRNVTVKKMLDSKAERKKQFSRRYIGLVVRGGCRDAEIEAKVERDLEEEVSRGTKLKTKAVVETDRTLEQRLKAEVFRSRDERMIEIFNVKSAYTTSGESQALAVVVTDSCIYITGLKHPDTTLCNYFVLPYTGLSSILIGPDLQTVFLSNYEKDMQTLIVTGCVNVTSELVGKLEFAMRRDKNKPKLAAVKQLCMRDMLNLRRAICKQTSVHKDEEYYFYSIVNMQDVNSDISESTKQQTTTKEGPLMFKISMISSRWETAYFILKAGILYMLSTALHKVPMRIFPLIDGACQGARRVHHSPRPHTFQIIVDGTVLYLAAPDEYVASEWLQALVHAASGVSVGSVKIQTEATSLMMTSEHVMLVREALPSTDASLTSAGHDPIRGARVLSCACLSDIVAFRLPSAEHSWCIVEFACREVHESSGDWILYFATNAELERFISTLEMLWIYQNEQGECFPLSTIPETDPLNKNCMDVYNQLRRSSRTFALSSCF